MNLNRVRAIVSKDFYWAKGNSKLLGITLMPALMNVFFAKVAGITAFATGLSFSISFLGVFLTSFLLIEEKRKGTLKALLTTPLTNAELLLGKFIFTFSLCILIACFSIVINKRYDILVNPLAIMNIAIFSATACFIGFIQGLFFKSEQEMSIAAPIVMLLFVVGPAIEEATDSEVAAFFPDYHFTHALDSGEISKFEAFFHSSFSFAIALAAFIFAIVFARFYFSNNNEKRFSSKLSVLFFGFISLFVISGFISPLLINHRKNIAVNTLAKIEFSTNSWSGSVAYNSSLVQLKQQTNTRDLKKYKLVQDDLEIGVQIRAARAQELTEKDREKKILSKKLTTVLAKEDLIINSLKFKKWVSFQSEEKLSVLVEAMCEQQLFQIFFDLKKNEYGKISKAMKLLDMTLKNSRLTCTKK
jgi:ABC-type transport system involved in multi-copper enzyme maturation permease subunit